MSEKEYCTECEKVIEGLVLVDGRYPAFLRVTFCGFECMQKFWRKTPGGQREAAGLPPITFPNRPGIADKFFP